MDIFNSNSTDDIIKLLSSRAHQPSGPIYKNIQKRNASIFYKKNKELEAICSLIESHSPTFRIKTIYRYDKILSTNSDTAKKTMNKENLEFNCPIPIETQIKNLKNKIKSMPKEWTLIQLTSQCNIEECQQIELTNNSTDPLFLTVFNCGTNADPFCLKIPAPVDVTGAKMQLCKEMRNFMSENRQLQSVHFGDIPLDKVPAKQKKLYIDDRNLLNIRLNEIVKQIEISWLRYWKCLLIGKLIDKDLNKRLENKIKEVLSTDNNFVATEKVLYILVKILACSPYMSSNELANAVNYCIPDNKELKNKMILMMKSESENYALKNAKRHPVILILDEKLDCFPWEMIEILQEHPVSRMPSLHFTYALFKEHEKTIKNGYKIIPPQNGRYIVNPGLDLKDMESRLSQFFKYWLPDWNGIIGQAPTSDEFSEHLNASEIFIYNGHGSGTQFLSGSKIQNMRVDGVVFLFGCASVRMQSDTCLVEMNDTFLHYMIACSPCVIGMLWEVTDYDTDMLSTDLLSRWIRSSVAQIHWNQIDKAKWNKGTIVPLKVKSKEKEQEYEPDLLRALNQARKAPTHHITRCAIVARGLPIMMGAK